MHSLIKCSSLKACFIPSEHDHSCRRRQPDGLSGFLWARERGILSISKYHYPTAAALTVILVLAAVQSVLTMLIVKSMKKESITERIRYNN